MDVNEVRVAEDKDFEVLKIYLSRNDGWMLEYQHAQTSVWTRQAQESEFKMIRIKTLYPDISAAVVYDVLQDQEYRSKWDKYFLETKDIGHLNPNNTLSYYAITCPSPMKNRDFVLQSSWLETKSEYIIINHSVHHQNHPPIKGFVRALSYLTGFLIKPINGQKGCEVGYVTHTNPRGKIPTWLTNKITSYVAPRMLRKLHKACIQYPQWKAQHRPNFKYWLNPEQLTSPKINMPDCTPPKHDDFESSSPDSCLEEDLNSLKIDSDNESLEDH